MPEFVERRRQPSFIERWKEALIAFCSMAIAGFIAFGAMDAKICKLQEETAVTKTKLDRMADDVSYLRGQWDMFMAQKGKQ